jgi:hypothetical protein
MRRLKELVTPAGGCVFALIPLVILPAVYLLGIVWVATKLLPLAGLLAVNGAAALPVLLIVSACLRRSRKFCGDGVVTISFIWGAGLWMWATLALYSVWGAFGLWIGLIFLGVGSVPVACVALLFAGKFAALGGTILAAVLVFGVRALGIRIASTGNEAEWKRRPWLASLLAFVSPLGMLYTSVPAYLLYAAIFEGVYFLFPHENQLPIRLGLLLLSALGFCILSFNITDTESVS